MMNHFIFYFSYIFHLKTKRILYLCLLISDDYNYVHSCKINKVSQFIMSIIIHNYIPFDQMNSKEIFQVDPLLKITTYLGLYKMQVIDITYALTNILLLLPQIIHLNSFVNIAPISSKKYTLRPKVIIHQLKIPNF